MSPRVSRRRLPAARVAAIVHRVTSEDAALLAQINDLTAAIHRLRSGVEPSAAANSGVRIGDLEKQVDDLYARRRKLAARAKVAALNSSSDRAER